MPISTNEQVINSFLNGRDAHGLNLSAQGSSLYSYNLKIAEWTDNGVIVYDFTATGNAFQSMTTSQHVGLIKRQVKSSSIMLPEVARHAGLIA
tara:strand:+ start:230 stop:508 length:279 start_codon:yes stop_codon:yes gene_type:complete